MLPWIPVVIMSLYCSLWYFLFVFELNFVQKTANEEFSFLKKKKKKKKSTWTPQIEISRVPVFPLVDLHKFIHVFSKKTKQNKQQKNAHISSWCVRLETNFAESSQDLEKVWSAAASCWKPILCNESVTNNLFNLALDFGKSICLFLILWELNLCDKPKKKEKLWIFIDIPVQSCSFFPVNQHNWLKHEQNIRHLL